MIEGRCHCGTVRWTFDGLPKTATCCNCTLCRRNGSLWAYDFEHGRIAVSGTTKAYIQGDRTLSTHFCPECGCVAYWRALTLEKDGRRRMAVNLRLADPDAVGAIAIARIDGRESWEHLPLDGRRIADLWF
jgi:hypothetical protein